MAWVDGCTGERGREEAPSERRRREAGPCRPPAAHRRSRACGTRARASSPPCRRAPAGRSSRAGPSGRVRRRRHSIFPGHSECPAVVRGQDRQRRARLKHLCPRQLGAPQADEQAAAVAGAAGRRLLLQRVVCCSPSRGGSSERVRVQACRAKRRPAEREKRPSPHWSGCATHSQRDERWRMVCASLTRAQHRASCVLITLAARQLQAHAHRHHIAALDACADGSDRGGRLRRAACRRAPVEPPATAAGHRQAAGRPQAGRRQAAEQWLQPARRPTWGHGEHAGGVDVRPSHHRLPGQAADDHLSAACSGFSAFSKAGLCAADLEGGHCALCAMAPLRRGSKRACSTCRHVRQPARAGRSSPARL